MPGMTIGTSLNRGFPGSFAAMPDDVIRSRVVSQASEAIPFGAAVMLNTDGTYALFATGGTEENFAGIAVRAVKQSEQYLSQGAVDYKPEQQADVMLRGEISVVCAAGNPTANGDVYVRITENTGVGGAVGGLEATADGANTVLVPNLRWVSNMKDADNVTSVCILTRNVP